MPESVNGEYFWGTTAFKHDLRIDPAGPINLRFLPESLQIKMLSNKVAADTPISTDHLKWIEHNCSSPYILGDDYILFSDEADRTLFLTAH